MKKVTYEREPQKVLGKQTVGENGIVCGANNPLSLNASFYWLENGELASKFTTNHWHQGHNGLVHGGILATALDEVMGRACTSYDERFKKLLYHYVTGTYNVKYLVPVPIGKELFALGIVTKREGRKVFTKGVILDEENTVLVESEGIYIDVDFVNDGENSDLSLYELGEDDPKVL